MICPPNVNSFLTILITVPLAILVVGPVTNVLSSLISAGVSGLYAISHCDFSRGVALSTIGCFWLHWPISAIGLQTWTAIGITFSNVLYCQFCANCCCTGCLLRTRLKDQKALAIQPWYRACSVLLNQRSTALAYL